MKSKRKLLKEMLFQAEHLSVLTPEVAQHTKHPAGFCSLLYKICSNTDSYYKVIRLIQSYYIDNVSDEFVLFWFTKHDWKTRYSFLKEVCRIELNPFNKLLYKLGLTKFRFITFEPSQQIW